MQQVLTAWKEKRAQYEALVAEYGKVAIGTYLGLFFATLFGFWFAITQGVEVQGAVGGTGTLGAAWLATKLTQPARIGATLVLTPLVATALRRLRGADD